MARHWVQLVIFKIPHAFRRAGYLARRYERHRRSPPSELARSRGRPGLYSSWGRGAYPKLGVSSFARGSNLASVVLARLLRRRHRVRDGDDSPFATSSARCGAARLGPDPISTKGRDNVYSSISASLIPDAGWWRRMRGREPTHLPPSPPRGLALRCRALASAQRLNILRVLMHGGRSLRDIAQVLEKPKTSVHYHVRALCRAGIVTKSAAGPYELVPAALDELHRTLEAYVSHVDVEASKSRK